MSFLRPVLAAALFASASAAEAQQRHRLNIPGGRLGDAIVALGRQTGISVGMSDQALADRRVSPIRGSLTVEQALRRLLQGQGARYVMIDAVTVRIVRQPVGPPPRPPEQRRARAPRPIPATPPIAKDVLGETEIVVTAARRPLPLRSYPGSVTIVDGNSLALQGARGTEALVARLPSLASTHLGPGRNKLYLRGISDSSFNGPTQATVGQYLGEARVNYNAPDPDLRLYDIERVEVLAGPQGTLYGAGSLGGIIRVVPNAPDPHRAGATASIGASWTQHGDPGADAAAMVNAPLAEGRLGLRLSGYAATEGGYIDDTKRGLEDVNRVRVAGGRMALRSFPDSYWTLDFSATGQRIRGEDAQYAERDQPPLTRESAIRQNFGNDYLLGSMVALREWDEYRFVATAGLVRQDQRERFDTTRLETLPAAYDLDTAASFLSAEARLSRKLPGDTGWLIGAAVLSNRSEQTREVVMQGTRSLRNRLGNDATEGSLYGEGTFGLAPGLTATLGGRVSTARLASSGFAFRPGFPVSLTPQESSRGETRFLPAAALAARAGPALLLYGRYQQSFRPGGLAIAGRGFNRFRSDRIASFETGMRYGTPGSGAFDASAALAYTRWSDIQADTIDNFAEPTTANVGDARIYTFDLSLGWRPLPGLALDAAAVFNDSKLSNLETPGLFSESGPPLPGVARFSGRLAGSYSVAASEDGGLKLSAAARYIGRSNLGVGDFLKRPQGDWLEVSLAARAETGRHAFTLGITNLLDTAASRFALGSPLLLNQEDYTTPVRPRTVRVGWDVRF